MNAAFNVTSLSWKSGLNHVSWKFGESSVTVKLQMPVDCVLILPDATGVAVIESHPRNSTTRATIWNADGTLRANITMPPDLAPDAGFYYFTNYERGVEVVIASIAGDKAWLIDLETGALHSPRVSR